MGKTFFFIAAIECSLLGFNALFASLLFQEGKQVIQGRSNKVLQIKKLLLLQMSVVTFQFIIVINRSYFICENLNWNDFHLFVLAGGVYSSGVWLEVLPQSVQNNLKLWRKKMSTICRRRFVVVAWIVLEVISYEKEKCPEVKRQIPARMGVFRYLDLFYCLYD